MVKHFNSIRIAVVILISTLSCVGAPHLLANVKGSDTDPVSQIQSLILMNSIGYLDAKVALDKMIDPDGDSAFVYSEIDRMEVDILEILKPNASDKEKAMVLRSYLYDSGAWNNFKPFEYDLDDPYGKSKTSRLLHHYIKSRRGNCVSMPILHAVLGRRLGLNMTLASAPNHILIMFTPDGGEQGFIEATSGGYPARLEWYMQNLPLTSLALKESIYMKRLNDRQVVGIMSTDLVNHLIREGEADEALKALRVIGKHLGRAPQIYILHSLAYSTKLDDEFYSQYPTESDMPPELMATFQLYSYQEERGINTAQALGYLGQERKVSTPEPQ